MSRDNADGVVRSEAELQWMRDSHENAFQNASRWWAGIIAAADKRFSMGVPVSSYLHNWLESAVRNLVMLWGPYPHWPHNVPEPMGAAARRCSDFLFSLKGFPYANPEQLLQAIADGQTTFGKTLEALKDLVEADGYTKGDFLWHVVGVAALPKYCYDDLQVLGELTYCPVAAAGPLNCGYCARGDAITELREQGYCSLPKVIGYDEPIPWFMVEHVAGEIQVQRTFSPDEACCWLDWSAPRKLNQSE